MRRITLLIAAIAIAPALLGAATAKTEPGTPTPFNVGFHTLPDGIEVGASYAGARVDAVVPAIRFVRVTADDADGFLARALADPNVRYAEVDGLAHALFAPNDPRYSSQYAPGQVRLPLAWDTSRGSTDAAVCVIDTGVRKTHEDLAATYKGGYDYVNGDADPADDHFHGTHVAGIAAATIHNGKGIAGAGNVAHYAVKVLGSGGWGYWSWVASGIVWCADNTPARTVLSMSLGGSGGDTTLRDAISYAFNTKGKLVVAAMGNTGDSTPQYPASYPYVMAIASTDQGETRSSYSSMGSHVSLAAPGRSILSAYYSSDGSYAYASGTSMATPLVSGIAALLWTVAPDLTNAQLRTVLEETAQDLGPAGHDNEYGWGEVDAYAAMSRVTLAPPRDVAAARGDAPGEIHLTWSPPDTTRTVTGYKVYAGNTATSTTLVATVTGTSFEETGIAEGHRRYYRVSALATDIEGVASPPVSSVPASRALPPKNAAASPDPTDHTRATLTWSPPADDGGLAITGYAIYRDAGDGYVARATVAAGATSYEDTELALGSKYRYLVRALNAAGASDPSNAACVRAGPTEWQRTCALAELASAIVCSPQGTAWCDAWNGDPGWGAIHPCREGTSWYFWTPVCDLPSARWIAEHA